MAVDFSNQAVRRLGMALESVMTRINLLFNEVENRPEDEQEVHEQLDMELNQLKTTGQSLPGDLVQLAERLEREFETIVKANNS